jgi:N-acetylmuramoyl-L-alanine amidase
MPGPLDVGRIGGISRNAAPIRILAAGAVCLFALLTSSVDLRANEPDSAPETALPATVLPVASGVRVVQSGEITRLAFDMTTHLNVRAFVMVDPDRLIVDLPETIFAIDADAGQRVAPRAGRRGPESAPAGLISSYRVGKLGAGRSRIVVDLARPARIVKAGTEVSDDGSLRLLVDLSPTDRASFAAAATEALRSAVPGKPQAAAAPAPSDKTKTVVVIDPGHGGIDTGAVAKGRAPEKEIVFAFAKALEGALIESGRYTVVLTRNEDVFVPLGERVRIAQAADAQLFLSIHADNLNEGGVSGATVYTVSDKASDAHAARLAEKENFADKIAGFDGVEEASGLSDILFDLTRRETRAYSHVFARTLVSVWKEAARLNKNPIRSAGFKVLKAPDVPSALLELGYLSSEKDSALLSDPQWRERTARAVARSIDKFFAMRSPAQIIEEKGGVASIIR